MTFTPKEIQLGYYVTKEIIPLPYAFIATLKANVQSN